MENKSIVNELIARARKAQEQIEHYDQEKVNELITAVAWALYKEENAKYLARLSVEETRMGNYEDKVVKNRRKTMGTLMDLLGPGAKSVGVIDVDIRTGITQIAKPMGVVAALTPVTNPAATPVNNTMMILKGRNAVILAPHPRGKRTCAETVSLMHHEMTKLGAPLDLVQFLEEPTKELTQELMRQVDLVVATGGPAMVQAAYSSGTPALGVGMGNAVVIIDPTADIGQAANKIVSSKIFDYATSCSSENSLVIHESIYDRVVNSLKQEGGYLASREEKRALQTAAFKNGHINPAIVGQAPAVIASLAGIPSAKMGGIKFIMVEEEGIGRDYPFSGEKLSIILSLYKYGAFEEALEKVERIIEYEGKGHSCGIHSTDEDHIMKLAERMPVSRILVNQAQAFGNGGNFDNGLNFTLTMGCGTWGGNSINENLSYKHFINITRLSRIIPEVIPSEEELWGAYLNKHAAGL
ncbi:MAG: aldehyde dehydrogenase family protein [Nitrospirae bacterium]|nr:aldehyde dehydrogenase family protein [Nitrospirota bacterium]